MKTATLSMSDNVKGMNKEITEIDEHMWDMYKLMSEDLDGLRNAVDFMAPSVSTMGPNMNQMRYDMNRGINSFTNPATFMQNMFNGSNKY